MNLTSVFSSSHFDEQDDAATGLAIRTIIFRPLEYEKYTGQQSSDRSGGIVKHVFDPLKRRDTSPRDNGPTS